MRRCGNGTRTAEPTVKRRASVSVELLIVTPVFLVMLLGFVELSMIVLVEERLAAASAQGARVASQGGSYTDIEAAVNTYLGPGPIAENLKPLKYTPLNPTTANSGDPVTVRVEVEGSKVVPDLLRFIGFGLSGQILVGQTTLRKE